MKKQKIDFFKTSFFSPFYKIKYEIYSKMISKMMKKWKNFQKLHFFRQKNFFRSFFSKFDRIFLSSLVNFKKRAFFKLKFMKIQVIIASKTDQKKSFFTDFYSNVFKFSCRNWKRHDFCHFLRFLKNRHFCHFLKKVIFSRFR